MMQAVSPIAVTDEIVAAMTAGAVVAFSVSGGKDSSVAAHAVNVYLDSIGHPREDRIAVHADLGRIEWSQSHAICESLAKQLGVELWTVRHSRHDMISRWEERFTRGKARYANLEIFNLIGPWSSASLRFCTAEMKQQVISPALKKRFPGRTIISVIGVRREESANRASTPVSKQEPRWDGRDGTRLISWNPIVNMLTPEVFAYHTAHRIDLHEAYTRFRSSRVSCTYCVLQKIDDQKASSACNDNHQNYRHLVEMEARSTFSFQPTRWLADVSPELLTPGLVSLVEEGKRRCVERRALEDAMPKGLRYTKGWPTRVPTMAEAHQVAAARRVILAHHGLEVAYPSPQSIVRRFEELMATARPAANDPLLRRQAAVG